jgi:isocitrate/isopropylmalate dehydrogenase
MTHRIAVIPGDGAGPEVVAEARKAVDALGLPLEWEALDWGTARYHAEGAMMPPDALDVRRVLEYAFERAEQRRSVVTSATKSNASRYGYVLWDDVADEIAADHPDVTYERVLVDALAARMVRDPLGLDVVVASNLFGDILTDLAAVLQGGMGMAASASLAPGSGTPGIFEPVHGSARTSPGRGSPTRSARSGARR